MTASTIQSLVSRNVASSMNDLDDMALPDDPPSFLRPNQKAIAEHIIEKLKQDKSHTFNSNTIAGEVRLSASTVKRALKQFQHLGILRLHKLRNGYVRYSYHADAMRPSMTASDAADCVIIAFPEQAAYREPKEPKRMALTKSEALATAVLKSIPKNLAASVWEPFIKTGCVTEQSWERYLEECFPVNVPF